MMMTTPPAVLLARPGRWPGTPQGGQGPGPEGVASDGGSEGGVAQGGTGPTTGGQGDGGATGEAGGASRPRCDGQCQPVVVLDPAPRNINRNVSLDVKNRVLVDQEICFWNYGYLPNADYEYTILLLHDQARGRDRGAPEEARYQRRHC